MARLSVIVSIAPFVAAYTDSIGGAIVLIADLMLTMLPPDAGKRGDAAFDVNNMPNAFVSKMRRKSSPPLEPNVTAARP